MPSPVVDVLRGRAGDRAGRRDEAPATWCAPWTGCCSTPTRRGGWGCAPTPTPPRTPTAPGAWAPQGIGLCRTEHMFLGDRRQLVERLILAEHRRPSGTPRSSALLPLQRAGLRRAARGDGRPAGDDPAARPAAARVPARPHRAGGAGRASPRRAASRTAADVRLLAAVERLHEQNPMLGLRGVRLGLVVPGLFALQVRAIAEAAAQLRPRPAATRGPRSWCRWSASVQELQLDPRGGRRDAAPRSPRRPRRRRSTIPIGTMIELPRAALTADRIAEAAEFFSFGTNDLTQTTWGFSRDDVEARVLRRLPRQGRVRASRRSRRSTSTASAGWSGSPSRRAARRARTSSSASAASTAATRSRSTSSTRSGLDYVSCSPFRVPVARLEAGRAAVLGT